GLVMNGNFLALDGVSQFALEVEHLNGVRVHSHVEYFVARFAVGLRAIHRDVGLSQNIFRSIITGLRKCNANARRCQQFMSIQRKSLKQRFLYTFGNVDRIVRILDASEQHAELGSAKTRYGVHFAHTELEPPPEFHQQLVAQRMTEAVIDQLKTIEIQEQDR